MYVCICNGYRDAEIREVAQSGVDRARDVYECLGAGPNCGKCLEFAQTLIDEERQGCASQPAARAKVPSLAADLQALD